MRCTTALNPVALTVYGVCMAGARASSATSTSWWEQDDAVALAVAGENLFVTGGAGTGKTETLRRIDRELRSARGEDAVALTATTGMAAKRLGGRTLANFAGLGAVDPLSITATEVLRRVQANAKAVARWRQTKTSTRFLSCTSAWWTS